jgi:hypothetical protein
MTTLPSNYQVKSATKGLLPVSSIVVGDQLLAVTSDLTTQVLATVSAVSNSTDTCIKLQALNGDLWLPVDAYVTVYTSPLSSKLTTDLTYWDLLTLHAPQDLGQGVSEPTAYVPGSDLLYGTDTDGFDLASKFAFLAGMFDVCGRYSDDSVIFSNIQIEVVNKAADLCLELAGNYVLDTTRYSPYTHHFCETGRGKAARILMEGMAPYLQTILTSELEFNSNYFLSRCFKTNSVADKACVQITTDVGEFLILDSGVAVK